MQDWSVLLFLSDNAQVSRLDLVQGVGGVLIEVACEEYYVILFIEVIRVIEDQSFDRRLDLLYLLIPTDVCLYVHICWQGAFRRLSVRVE